MKWVSNLLLNARSQWWGVELSQVEPPSDRIGHFTIIQPISLFMVKWEKRVGLVSLPDIDLECSWDESQIVNYVRLHLCTHLRQPVDCYDWRRMVKHHRQWIVSQSTLSKWQQMVSYKSLSKSISINCRYVPISVALFTIVALCDRGFEYCLYLH